MRYNYKINNIKRYNSIGRQEIVAVNKVLKSGILSDYVGKKGKYFLGGKLVRTFENKIKSFFNVKYCVAVNSWTSGLITALGAIGIEPGDEVICTPWTMSACAISIIHWNAIPVFVDIDLDTFNYDLEKLKKKISKKTKAIILVDIFGQSENIDEIKKIVKKLNIKIISDSAQAIGSLYKKKFSGTLGDVGGFSFNYHKHINTGEGGAIVTNNINIAKRCRLIRNHGESVIPHNSTIKSLSNIIGYNFRMGEIEAAIGIQQLKKLKSIISFRQKLASKLIDGLKNFNGIKTPIIKKNCSHVFYVFPMVLDMEKIKISRKKIISTLRKNGIIGLNEGYSNLHLLPIFKKKIAYGQKGFPWSLFKKKMIYQKSDCPNAEKLHRESFFYISLCSYDFKLKHMKKYTEIFKKTWEELGIN
jgi:perosamine synthetase